MENSKNKAWEYYERGRSYNNRLVPNLYNMVDANLEFMAGNQWINLPAGEEMQKLPKPVFNIIERIASLFISSLTSNATTIRFDPLAYYDGTNVSDPDSDASVYATEEVKNLLEKFGMDYRIRDALYDGAATGDYCAHFWWDPEAMPYGGAFGAHRGEIQMELVDGVNVMFGNPNIHDVQKQPYILLVGRDTADNLKDESSGGGDWELQWQAGQGGKTELNMNGDGTDKKLFVLLYTKKTVRKPVLDGQGEPVTDTVVDSEGNPVCEQRDGKDLYDPLGMPIWKKKKRYENVTEVYATKATRSGVIFEDVNTGLTRYPVAFGNWRKQKNQYHGRALVTSVMPNQIFINRMFALMMRHLELSAMPKTIYNKDMIAQWDNSVGRAIGVYNLQPNQNLQQAAYNLAPAEMSTQIMLCIDKAMQYTKECMGATDAQMGNVKPDNTSALMVLQSSSEVPLENIRAGLNEWLEDIAAILLDMMGTYYGKRPIVRDRKFEDIMDSGDTPLIGNNGQMVTSTVTRRVIEEWDFSQLKHLWLNVRVDVGATTRFSEIAMTQTLDNLRHDGILGVIQYLKRIPDKYIPQKQELIDDLQQQAGMQEQNPIKQQNYAEGSIDESKAVAQMTPQMQTRYGNLPGTAQNALKKSQQMRS